LWSWSRGFYEQASGMGAVMVVSVQQDGMAASYAGDRPLLDIAAEP
jgi:hypothetical protein